MLGGSIAILVKGNYPPRGEEIPHEEVIPLIIIDTDPEPAQAPE